MGKLIDRLKSDFKDKLSNGLSVIEVDELGDDSGPFKIYFRRMTLEQQGKIYKAMSTGNLDFMALSLIERALDEDGKKMLVPSDIVELKKRSDGELVQKICAMMSEEQERANDPEEIEEAEKK